MKLGTKMASLALLTTMAGSLSMPAVLADTHQTNKNNWRNLATAGAAVAGYGLLKHNTLATVLGAAGAAYSAKRYEDERHAQSQASSARNRYYHRTSQRFYGHNGRKYYTYNGHLYYRDLHTGVRHIAD